MSDLSTIFGNVITSAADAYLEHRFPVATGGGNFLPQMPPSGPLYGWDDLMGYLQNGGGDVEVKVDPDTGTLKCKPCKRKRRRRRSLVTASELNQLSALKGVLGQGKAFETWIATRRL